MILKSLTDKNFKLVLDSWSLERKRF